MNQAVIVFSNAAARSAAIASPIDGMLTYLEDLDTYESYTAGAWVTVADGTGWTTFVPSFTNLTVGNGTYAYAKFKVIGKTAQIGIRFIFGSTSAITGSLVLNLPSNLRRTTFNQPSLASGLFRDATGSLFSPSIVVPSPSTKDEFFIRANNAAGTYLTQANLTSTIPFTWATDDEIQISLMHEVD
jgi:hypothetical protein